MKAVKGILNPNKIEMDQKQWEFFKVRCLAGRHWPEVTLAMGKSWGPSWSRELQHQQLNICSAGCNILPLGTQTYSSPVQCPLLWEILGFREIYILPETINEEVMLHSK